MKLAWCKSNEPEQLQSREIPRNCGQLLGRLDGLLPCLYFAQHGASAWEMRKRVTNTALGLFAVGVRTGGRPGVSPRVGLLLPLHLCRDEIARAALWETSALIDSPQDAMSDKRRVVQAKLNEAFGGDLLIADKESLDGFFALRPDPGLFQRLCENFDYVTGVIDNPADSVRITSTARFYWRSYGELMEWHHGLRGSDRFGAWSSLTPFFLSGNIGALQSYSTERWARAGLHRPAEDPSKWFMIRPDLPNAKLGIRLEMDEHGWVGLPITLDAVTVMIYLSEVYDPFDGMVAWGREIGEGELPIEMEIDEEGQVAVLTALPTGDPGRVLLRVSRKYDDEILLEGIVSRTDLAASMKAELRRFFTTEFDPQHWDLRSDDLEDDFIQTKDRVVNHAWFTTNK